MALSAFVVGWRPKSPVDISLTACNILQIVAFEIVTLPPYTQTDKLAIYDGNSTNGTKLFEIANGITITNLLFNSTG